MTSIILDNLSKEFDGGARAVTDLTFEVGQGELFVVVGPSGSGKTTVLRLIAGLETPTRGTIRFDGVDVTASPAWQRGTALVAESAALLPQATVADNLLWSRRERTRSGWDRWWPWSSLHRSLNEQNKDRQSVAKHDLKSLARQLGLLDFLERKPHTLSAGQQQRVALGRALLAQPRVLLLDEPLGRLDGTRRSDLARALKRIHRRSQATWVYVTHDRREAVMMADRIAVLENGRLLQVGGPAELAARPQHRLVAAWEADGALTVLDGVWRWQAGQMWFFSRWLSDPVPLAAGVGRDEERQDGEITSDAGPRRVEATWRPDQVTVESAEASESPPRHGESVCVGVVEEIEERGSQVLVGVELTDAAESITNSLDPIECRGSRPKQDERRCGPGSADADGAQRRVVGLGRTDQRLRPGVSVRVRFDWARAHWFDSVSGQTMSAGEGDV